MPNRLVHVNDELLRLTTEMAGIAIWEYDFEASSLRRTPNHDSLYGLAWQVHWNIDTFLNAIFPEDRQKCHETIDLAVAPGGSADYALDFRVIWPDGSLHWLWVRGEIAKRDEAGKGVLVRGVLLDVSQRKQNEAKIERLTALYAALSQCNQAIVRSTNE